MRRPYELVELFERKLAHWLRLVFPKMMAPAFRNFAATPASRGTLAPSRANDPATDISESITGHLGFTVVPVLFILSIVAILFCARQRRAFAFLDLLKIP